MFCPCAWQRVQRHPCLALPLICEAKGMYSWLWHRFGWLGSQGIQGKYPIHDWDDSEMPFLSVLSQIPSLTKQRGSGTACAAPLILFTPEDLLLPSAPSVWLNSLDELWKDAKLQPVQCQSCSCRALGLGGSHIMGGPGGLSCVPKLCWDPWPSCLQLRWL